MICHQKVLFQDQFPIQTLSWPHAHPEQDECDITTFIETCDVWILAYSQTNASYSLVFSY